MAYKVNKIKDLKLQNFEIFFSNHSKLVHTKHLSVHMQHGNYHVVCYGEDIKT